MIGCLLDQVLSPGGISVRLQPILRALPGRQREGWGFEALSRGPRGSRMESAELLFPYAQAKRRESDLDAACVDAILCPEVVAAVPPPHRLTLNLNAVTLSRDPAFAEVVIQRVEAADFDPSRLVAEIVALDSHFYGRRVDEALQRFRDAGIAIALDDLGAGAANLDRLLEWSPDVVKLDRALVLSFETDPRCAWIVESLVRVCRRCEVHLIAEGVETEAVLDRLVELGVELFQGNLLGRPSPLPEGSVPAP